ncbi:ATP-dependent DNA ligase [Actinoplanes sp. NPDC049316]|uniref:ATP-dependent DNA ligase n=1 Tax=Actinoplanes sp. NPDC049316 TaxID=3154727 RepID=UPI0034418E8F
MENDGWRCLAFVRPNGVYLQSRQAKDLTPYFPDVVAAVRESLPPGTVVDGELVVSDTEAGSTMFPALLGRITAGRRLAREAAARPANLVVFDVLADAGDDLTDLPLRQRRSRLENLLAEAPPTLTLCPQTSDVKLARTWFDELGVTGAEGLVVKDLAGVYRVGGRGSSWWKYKRKVTVEAIVGGVTGAIEDPRTLLLGRFDGRGRLRYVAGTVPLALSQRQEIGRVLTAATGVHPWPQPLPVAWIGHLDRREPRQYLQVAPLLVVEIVVDQAYDRGRFRHPVRHLRIRADLAPTDVDPCRPGPH